MTAAAGVLLLTGALATAGGPHSGGGAERVDRLWRLQPLIYVHAATVGVFAVSLVFVLGYLASQRQRWPRLFGLGLAVFAVLLAQMALGRAAVPDAPALAARARARRPRGRGLGLARGLRHGSVASAGGSRGRPHVD